MLIFILHSENNKKLAHDLSVKAQSLNIKLKEEELLPYRQFQANCFNEIRELYTGETSLTIQPNLEKHHTELLPLVKG